jgi:hypothetical protein
MLIAVQLNELLSEQGRGLFMFHESGTACNSKLFKSFIAYLAD